MDPVMIIAIAGGSGSGKTTLVNGLIRSLESAVVVRQDWYYGDLAHLPLTEREVVNFDHPDALDFDLLLQHLVQLKQRLAITVPTYDFTTHTRSGFQTLDPQKIVLVEGTLILAIEPLCHLFDLSLFLDAEADVRLARKLTRDVSDRGRSLKASIEQYVTTVKPMHDQFVQPSSAFADFVLDGTAPPKRLLEKAIEQVSPLLNLREFT